MYEKETQGLEITFITVQHNIQNVGTITKHYFKSLQNNYDK